MPHCFSQCACRRALGRPLQEHQGWTMSATTEALRMTTTCFEARFIFGSVSATRRFVTNVDTIRFGT
jgi:hypothetical protein